MTPSGFTESLIVYCSATGASVTSWGRTVKHNRAENGLSTSYHLVWLGADVVYDTLQGEEYRRILGRRLGLEVVIESDHDHLEPLRLGVNI